MEKVKGRRSKVKGQRAYDVISTLTLDQGETRVNALATSGNFLYAALSTGRLVKIQLKPFTKVATLTMYASALVARGSFLYAGASTSSGGRMAKINLANLTEVASLPLDPVEGEVSSFAVSGKFLYAATNRNVIKINLMNFSRVAASTIVASQESVTNMAVSGHFLYAGICKVMEPVNPAKIVRINLNNFTGWTGTDTLQFGPTEGAISPCVLAIFDNYLYAGFCEVLVGGVIYKIDLSNFTIAYPSLHLATAEDDENLLRSFASLGDRLFVGFGPPGKIAEVDLKTFTQVSSLTLAQGNNLSVATLAFQKESLPKQASLSNWVTCYLYAGLDSTPGQVVKIGPWTYPRLRAL